MKGFIREDKIMPKTRWRIGFLIGSILALALFSICFFPVVKEQNTSIVFSYESGFYENPFELEIESPASGGGYSLHYTLDGSTPDLQSPLYTKSLFIDDASLHPNVYSMREDVSAGFGREGYDYAVPEELVDKCTVVRAALLDTEGVCIREETRVYFVGFERKTGYDNMKFVSIVTDPDNLFDDETGIYVTGNIFRRYVKECEEKNTGLGILSSVPTNYSQTGIQWEREVFLDVFDEDRNLLFSTKAGLRTQGQGSRLHPQKSIRVYAREEYSGSKVFPYDIFDNGVPPHKFVINSGASDVRVKIKDWISMKIAREMELNFAAMKMMPCVMFLDGEYWGVYYISETYDDDYISLNYGVDKDNILMIKNGGLEVGDGENFHLYDEMEAFICNNDMRDSSNFEKVCEMIDIDSFVDYYAFEIFIANQDWPQKNFALWRAVETDSKGRYYDGKWRWMLFDTNLYAVMIEYDDDTIQHAIEEKPVFASLVQNPEVQKMLEKRMNEIQEVYSENYHQIVDEWLDEMEKPVLKSGQRFFGQGIESNMEEELNLMKEFYSKREGFLRQCMEVHFNG